jgi:hypothetical protein
MQLTVLPPEIGQLTSLQSLSLSSNRLTVLPPEIGQLTSLHSLYIGNNQLTGLPSEIGQLTALRRLDLGQNQLTALPPEIGQLMALTRLDLRQNQLTTLPLEIGQLTQLVVSVEEEDGLLTEGLLVDDNAFPHPYPLLIAGGQPSATANIIAWLRGELDLSTLPPVAEPPDASRDIEIGLPQEPQPEAGPTFTIRSGILDLLPGPETDQAFDRSTQAAIHRRIIRQIEPLRAETSKVGNRHPGLALTVEEYANLVNKPLDDLDVTDLWAVGNGLLAHAASFEKQNERRTLTEPLEPSHLALLLDVARLHAGFILGFPKGIELTERADRSQITPNIVQSINDPTSRVLAALAQQRKLVSERARRLIKVLEDALIVGGWETARVGYTSYATVRNALIELGKWLIFINDRAGLIGGVLIAASGLSPETTRPVVQFLMSNASDVLSFAAPFPELRAWLSWIIGHFDNEHRTDNIEKGL